MASKITKDGWVEIFRETGLNEEQMHKWHHLFETKFPESHDEFLKWLGIEDTEITKIRENSQ